MSNQVKILVFHAPDAQQDAKIIQNTLQRLNFEAKLLDDLLPAKQNNTFYQQIIEEFDKVIFVVSDGLFTNCYMLFAAGTALGQNKAVSVANRASLVIVPTAFAYAFRNHTTNLNEVEFKLRKA